MLPTELLMFRVEAGLVKPKRLARSARVLSLAQSLIDLFTANIGERRRTIGEHLAALEGNEHKVVRGLAHLLMNGHATFEARSPLEPGLLRHKVFALAQQGVPSRGRRAAILEEAARSLGNIGAEDVLSGLYADLPENQVLSAFEPPLPEDLIDRYNLAQAQGVLYRAFELVITARRNEPARYKQLFSYLKLFGLMATVEGDADYGFTLTLDGPTSILRPSTRYGLAMAKFLPALLHVTQWDLTATLRPRKDLAWVDPGEEEWRFELTSESGLVSHYAVPDTFDSALEAAFAERFEKLHPVWALEREVDLVPVPGGAIIPDFRLVHPDGRSALLEIVGYWRPEYLRKKFALLKRSGRSDVILAVSERLNLEKAGVDVGEFGERVLFFKGALPPKEVLSLAERVAVQAAA